MDLTYFCFVFASFGFKVLCKFWICIYTFFLLPPQKVIRFQVFPRFSETLNQMCFTTHVACLMVRCCVDKGCIGDVCVPHMIEMCREPEVVFEGESQHNDYAWIQMMVLVGLLLLCVGMRLLR